VVGLYLRRDGHDVVSAADGEEALDLFRRDDPDLVVLDLMLPKLNGLEVCRRMQAERRVPLIMLTARGEEDDRIIGLGLGADDYVVKPFKPKELVARLRTRLRRTEADPAEQLTIGDLAIDVPGHQVSRNGTPISLTPLEFDLLVALARKPRQVFTREVLLEQVWGYRHAADTRLVNVHVQRLRSKIERDPECPEVVLTVRGVGYKAGTT
jgi:two-component system response regulator MtrA